ncbi:alpha/beta hydrolase [Paenibacillus swuensis]|uniref:Alpha/beta hydrolase n=1 Tax=Paenibacillus swuensis TaxID=1178515 RepID=A0A172TJF9_9BACL|nr:alpha/beta hydrolase [Paenibacillus swuensis]ANE46933.1 alpha/beta hydrolase [Paenibacillus swuensis]
MGYITVESGVNLYFEDIGEGKPVLFLHGWPLNGRQFEYQTGVLPYYGFRCITIDFRGFGNSDNPWQGYNYDRMSDDVRNVIERLQLNEVTLAGFSMGGAVALRYMRRHAGSRISKLALLAAAAPSFTQKPGYPYGMKPEEVNKLIEQTFRDRPKMLAEFGKKFFASDVTPAFRQWFQSLGLQASLHGTVGGAAALRDEDMRADLAAVRVPTGIFHGKLDQICPYEFALELHKGIPGSLLYPFEKSGHAIFYDELERFNATFLQFISDRNRP